MRITKRKARKEAFEHGFRSKFEFDFSKRLQALKLKAEYEKEKLDYIQPEKYRKYLPDWKIATDKYIETKGIFSASDRQKILYVMRANPSITIYILFQNSKVRLSKISKTTYGEWCTKNGIIWADIKDEKKWRQWFE